MNKLRRQILTLGLCFAAAMAARVYFNKTAEKIEKDTADEIVEHPAPEAEIPASALEVELPKDGQKAAAVQAAPAAATVEPPTVAKGTAP